MTRRPGSNRNALRTIILLLVGASASSGESQYKQLIRLLNEELGKTQAQIMADFPTGQMTKTSAGQPAWFWESDKPALISDPGRPASRTARTTTEIEPGESKTIDFGTGSVVTKTQPGTARSTTVIQDDPAREPFAYYVHLGHMFCFDADGKVYRWEAWRYPSRGPTPTELEGAHPSQLWHMDDAWELRTDKKGRAKPVHVIKGGRILY